MSQAPQIDLNALWKYVTDQVKARTTLPGLWRAMEAARPITIESDELVIGFDSGTVHQSHLLLDNRFRNTIEQTLQAATRKRLTLRTIIGETIADWETYKAQQVEAARLEAESREHYHQKVESGESWDAVGEQCVRKIGALPNRNLGSVQGRVLVEIVEVLAEAHPRLVSDPPTELDDRSYTRALERIAERVSVPSAVIAYLVCQRLRP
jgi:hypothetical protein